MPGEVYVVDPPGTRTACVSQSSAGSASPTSAYDAAIRQAQYSSYPALGLLYFGTGEPSAVDGWQRIAVSSQSGVTVFDLPEARSTF